MNRAFKSDQVKTEVKEVHEDGANTLFKKKRHLFSHHWNMQPTFLKCSHTETLFKNWLHVAPKHQIHLDTQPKQQTTFVDTTNLVSLWKGPKNVASFMLRLMEIISACHSCMKCKDSLFVFITVDTKKLACYSRGGGWEFDMSICVSIRWADWHKNWLIALGGRW